VKYASSARESATKAGINPPLGKTVHLFVAGPVVVESGQPRDVLTNPQHTRTHAFLSKVL